MLTELQAIALGIIQGLAEFLPISSSAHLVLVPWFFGWDDPGLAFDVALHLGTLFALLAYYWREWLAMVMSVANGDKPSQRLLGLLILASIPGAVIGLLLEKQAESIFRSPALVACALAGLGIVLWIADIRSPRTRKISQIAWTDALLIGLSQALAIVPGVSRSGATITTARILGIDRQDAANFSFLMATPIIAGAGLLETRKLLHSSGHAELMLGFLASAIFGVIAIAALIKFVRTRTYRVFAWYRIALAALVFAVLLMGH